MKRYRIMTLGCKVNQCESAALAHQLEGTGARPHKGPGSADLVIVNTCTVTGKAAMQSRQTIRRAIRSHPQARIVVTGCYAQTAPEEIQAIQEVDLIVGHADKLRIAELIQGARLPVRQAALVKDNIFQCREFAKLPWAAPEDRTRAFLKIQDGCSAMCSYCIVPYARGRSRSMPVADVVSHLQALGRSGFREVVLTGIHLGAYGTDLEPPVSLSQLLFQISQKPPVDRLRLSSIEPGEVDANLLQMAAFSSGFICSHLHLPLQSGDNVILQRMGRPYTREDFTATVHAVRKHLPDAAIGADVLVGFPGEDEAAFGQTLDLIRALPLTYLHVFPFSPRKGTPAASYKGHVPQRMVKERCRRLRELGEAKKQGFLNSLVGHTVQVLVQKRTDPKTGYPSGLSHNYVTVYLQGSQLEVNALVKARIESVSRDLTVTASLL